MTCAGTGACTNVSHCAQTHLPRTWRSTVNTPGCVVQLLGHVLADALHLAAAGAGGALGLVMDLAARQVRGQRLALGLLLVAAGLVRRRGLLDLGGQRGQVGVHGLFEQALLLGVEGLGLGGELQPLQDRDLVGELVDGGLLEGDLAIVALDLVGLAAIVPASESTASRSCCAFSWLEVLRVDHERD